MFIGEFPLGLIGSIKTAKQSHYSKLFSYSSEWNPVWFESAEAISAVNSLVAQSCLGFITAKSLLLRVHIIKNGRWWESNMVSKI